MAAALAAQMAAEARQVQSQARAPSLKPSAAQERRAPARPWIAKGARPADSAIARTRAPKEATNGAASDWKEF
jgi:hypothetical protein